MFVQCRGLTLERLSGNVVFMGKRKKQYNLKEPSPEKIDESMEAIVEFVEHCVMKDYRGKCTSAELRMLRALYLTRANELVLDRNYQLRVELYGEPGSGSESD